MLLIYHFLMFFFFLFSYCVIVIVFLVAVLFALCLDAVSALQVGEMYPRCRAELSLCRADIISWH